MKKLILLSSINLSLVLAACGSGEPSEAPEANATLGPQPKHLGNGIVGICDAPTTVSLPGSPTLVRKPTLSYRTIAFTESSNGFFSTNLGFYDLGPDEAPGTPDDNGPTYLPTLPSGYSYERVALYEGQFAAVMVADLASFTGYVFVIYAGSDALFGTSDDLGPMLVAPDADPSELAIRGGIVNWRESSSGGLVSCDIVALPTSTNSSCWGQSRTYASVTQGQATWVDRFGVNQITYSITQNTPSVVMTMGGVTSTLLNGSDTITSIDVAFGLGGIATVQSLSSPSATAELHVFLTNATSFYVNTLNLNSPPTLSQRGGMNGEVWYAASVDPIGAPVDGSVVGIAAPQSAASTLIALESSARNAVVDGNAVVYRRLTDNSLGFTLCY